MRILLCSPLEGAVGGIQRWTNHILKYYQKNVNPSDIDLDIYSLDRKTSVVTGTSLIKRLISGLREYPALVKGYKNEIIKNQYDIVHITSSASISLLKDIAMLRFARKKGLKSIIHFRFGRIPELLVSKNWEYKLLLKVIRLADIAVVIDQKSYDSLKIIGCSNIQLLPNPVTPEIHQIIERNPNIKRDTRKILFAGHVKETKGVFELIEACKQIENVSVKLIGKVTDEMRAVLLNKINETDSWLDIAGELEYEDTIKEMMSCGVFVLPTYTEGFPNVILESMACACPIIATSVGAIPEMLSVNEAKHYGICIESKNTEQLKVAINKMLNQPDFARECGENAQERVNTLYSMPIVWTQITNLWKSLLN